MLKVGVFSSALLALSLIGCGHQVVKNPDSQAPQGTLSSYQYHGFYILGHEVSTLTLCGQKAVYGVVADQHVQARLQQGHQELTSKPYQATYIRFNGYLLNQAGDGFAVDYDGQMAVGELISIQGLDKSGCS